MISIACAISASAASERPACPRDRDVKGCAVLGRSLLVLRQLPEAGVSLEAREGGAVLDRKAGLGSGLLKLSVNGRDVDFLARDVGEDGSLELIFRTWSEPSTSRVHVFRFNRESRRLEEISSIASRYEGVVELLDDGRLMRVPRLPRPHELRYGPKGYQEEN